MKIQFWNCSLLEFPTATKPSFFLPDHNQTTSHLIAHVILFEQPCYSHINNSISTVTCAGKRMNFVCLTS